MKKTITKYIFLFWFGGSAYVTFEVFYRNRSHWSMFILAGVIFIIVGCFNEFLNWTILTQTIIGTLFAVVSEFIFGCVLNLYYHLNIWDYSNLPGNILGQVCPQFTIIWFILVFACIIIDDIIRWKFFQEEKPEYLYKIKF